MKALIVLSFCLILFSCTNEVKNITNETQVDLHDYYFPIHDLDEKIVYVYEQNTEFKDTSVQTVFYTVIESAKGTSFFYKYYNADLQIRDSILYRVDDKGVSIAYRYTMVEGIWNRVLFDMNAYFHLHTRSKLDTTKTKLQSVNQYGRRLDSEMKIYFDGFSALETPYYKEDKVSVIHIESNTSIKEVKVKEKVQYKESTIIYNMEGVGTVKSVSENPYGKSTNILKEQIDYSEFKELLEAKRTPGA